MEIKVMVLIIISEYYSIIFFARLISWMQKEDNGKSSSKSMKKITKEAYMIVETL